MAREPFPQGLVVVVGVVLLSLSRVGDDHPCRQVGIALSLSSALQTFAFTRTRSPTTRSVIFVWPCRRTFVSSLTVIEVFPVPATYARPQRLPLVTSTLRGAPLSVPFSTTVTFGLHPSPIVGFLPLSAGEARAFPLGEIGPGDRFHRQIFVLDERLAVENDRQSARRHECRSVMEFALPVPVLLTGLDHLDSLFETIAADDDN